MIGKADADRCQIQPVAIARDNRYANDLFQLGNLL
jgi:hypothetical protein